jgi:molybdopterin synthase catalytic subunit
MLSEGVAAWFVPGAAAEGGAAQLVEGGETWRRLDVPFGDGSVASPPADVARDASSKAVFVQLAPTELHLASLYAAAVSTSCGAIASFVGTTRDTFEEKRVERLSYEMYGAMALTTLARIAIRCFAASPGVRRIIVSHRSGDVPAGHASVVIHVTSVHRKDALCAVASAIEALKADAPIWKREVYAPASPATTRRARESDADAPPPPSATSAWKVNAECKHDTR